MKLLRSEIMERFDSWLISWNEHDLKGVMDFMHEEIVFENWNGTVVAGKSNLERAWLPWFAHHGNFKFTNEDLFIDEQEQKMTFLWKLEWPSLEKYYKGNRETRRGVDVLHFLDKKIVKKYSYSKTNIQIGTKPIILSAGEMIF
jgi:hypothetical protein